MSPHGCVSKNKPLFAIANHVDSQQGPSMVNCLGTNRVQPGPTEAHHGQTEPTGANWSQLTPTDSNQGQQGLSRANQGSTGTNQGQPCQLGPTEGNRGQLGPTGPNRVQPSPTGSNWIQLGLTRPNQGHMRPTRAIKAFQTPSVHFQDTLLTLSRHLPDILYTLKSPRLTPYHIRHLNKLILGTF